MQIPIKQTGQANVKKLALFNLGFRPFFLGASFFAFISIALWMLVYFSYVSIPFENIQLVNGMAVVAGFLLTAVKSWTGLPTLFGRSLMVLLLLWCVPRILFLFGSTFLLLIPVTDLLFGLVLIIAVTIPIVKAEQWKQLAVVGMVSLL